MKTAPKRGTQATAAQAARRSAEGPANSSRSREPKRPPPVTNCLKCQVLKDAKAEAAALRQQMAERDAIDAARAHLGAQTGVTEEQVSALHARQKAILAAGVEDASARAVETAKYGNSTDALAATKWITDQLFGPLAQRIDHRHHVEFDASLATDEELDVLARAREIITRLSTQGAA